MVIKSIVARDKNGKDEVLNVNTVIERLKKLRALNKGPDSIGLTQYTWRSFSISKSRQR